MLMENARSQIVAYGKQLLTEGLVSATAGNLSIYDPAAGTMAISPSGIPYFETKEEDVVIMTLDGRIVEGDRKPSSEHGLHAAVYQVRPDAGAVVHTHSTYATTLSCLGEPVRAVHFVLGNLLGKREVPVVPYRTYGTPELAAEVRRVMADSAACLLANHGMVASAGTMADAYLLAATVESVAGLQWRAECIGRPYVLSDEEIRDTWENFTRNYGQK